MDDKEREKNEKKRINLWFIVISIFFGTTIALGRIDSDDARALNELGTSVIDCWKWSTAFYSTWSSRVLINFIWALALKKGRIVWALIMSISMFVYQKSIYVLGEKSISDKNKYALFCTTLASLFPFYILSSAGWVATTISYYCPQAFMIMAIIPIKKEFCGEKYTSISFGLFSLALIFAANAEQPCAVLAVLYVILFIYKTTQKTLNIRTVILTAISVISLIIMLTCPGNWGRADSEIASWFPTYNMLDAVDKMDIGVSTTLHWIFVEGKVFTLSFCIFLIVLVWKKYDTPIIRLVSALPFASAMFLGPLKNAFFQLFPYTAYLSENVPFYGSFSLDSLKTGTGVVMFAFMLFLSVCVFISVVVLIDELKNAIAALLLLCGGVASHVMMGFSPTVYASSDRTYSTMIVCFTVVLAQLYVENEKSIEESVRENSLLELSFGILVFYAYMNLLNMIIVTFA